MDGWIAFTQLNFFIMNLEYGYGYGCVDYLILSCNANDLAELLVSEPTGSSVIFLILILTHWLTGWVKVIQ